MTAHATGWPLPSKHSHKVSLLRMQWLLHLNVNKLDALYLMTVMERKVLLFKIYIEFFTDAIIVKYLGENITVKIFFTDMTTLFISACKSWIIYLHEAIYSIIKLQQILVDVLGKVFTWSYLLEVSIGLNFFLQIYSLLLAAVWKCFYKHSFELELQTSFLITRDEKLPSLFAVWMRFYERDSHLTVDKPGYLIASCELSWQLCILYFCC